MQLFVLMTMTTSINDETIFLPPLDFNKLLVLPHEK